MCIWYHTILSSANKTIARMPNWSSDAACCSQNYHATHWAAKENTPIYRNNPYPPHTTITINVRMQRHCHIHHVELNKKRQQHNSNFFYQTTEKLKLFSNFSVHPLIQVPNQLVGAPVGTDVTLVCNAEASPKAINYWQRENGKCMHIQYIACTFQTITRNYPHTVRNRSYND